MVAEKDDLDVFLGLRLAPKMRELVEYGMPHLLKIAEACKRSWRKQMPVPYHPRTEGSETYDEIGDRMAHEASKVASETNASLTETMVYTTVVLIQDICHVVKRFPAAKDEAPYSWYMGDGSLQYRCCTPSYSTHRTTQRMTNSFFYSVADAPDRIKQLTRELADEIERLDASYDEAVRKKAESFAELQHNVNIHTTNMSNQTAARYAGKCFSIICIHPS
jgi:hypothetical protein